MIKWKSAQSFKKDLTREAIFLWACIQLWISLEQSFHFTGSHSLHTPALKFNECTLCRRLWQHLRYISKWNDVNQKKKKEMQVMSFIVISVLIVSELLCFEFQKCSLLRTKQNPQKEYEPIRYIYSFPSYTSYVILTTMLTNINSLYI